jgi:arginine exporter protein ArgO
MTEQLELLAKLETYVGAAFVAFYGYERFRKQPAEPGARQTGHPSRATTTAASYYTAVVLYCGIGVLV